MKSLPYFPFYPGEWLRSTTVLRMDLQEQGAYLKLLCWQWDEGHIDPDDLTLLLGLPQETIDAWFKKKHWRKAFEVGEDGMLRNARLHSDREAALQKVENASAAANARWAKHRASGKPKIKRRNADEELSNAVAHLETEGVALPSDLVASMTAYKDMRRDKRHGVWSKDQWLLNLKPEFTFDEWREAYDTATRSGWKSVHPKKQGSMRREGGKALKSLQEWVNDDDLPY